MHSRLGTIIFVLALLVVLVLGFSWILRGSKNVLEESSLPAIPVTKVDRGLPPSLVEELEAQIEKEDDLMELAALQYQLGDLLSAKLVYEELLVSEPENALALENLGQTLFEMQAYAKAEERLRQSFVLEPRASVVVKLVLLLRAQGKNEEAERVKADAAATLGEQPEFSQL